LASTAGEFRVGAAIVRGRRVVSIGWNQRKTHPKSLSRYKAHHAEFHSIVGMHKFDLVGSDIYVARVTPGGNIGMAKPCIYCQAFLRSCGIRRAYFTTDSGFDFIKL